MCIQKLWGGQQLPPAAAGRHNSRLEEWKHSEDTDAATFFSHSVKLNESELLIMEHNQRGVW